MQKQTFRTEELKDALERALEFRIRSLERIGGGGAMNFKAERDSDGLPFIAKCFSPDRLGECERLTMTLRTMEGVKTPRRIFADRPPVAFAGHLAICLTWYPGEFLDVNQLTDGQWAAFLDDYVVLSDRMQSVTTAEPAYPLYEWWEQARRSCHGLGGRILRPVLEALNERDFVRDPERMRITHGDFHRGNLLFREDRLECFLDLESFRMGYPAEDIACYCLAKVSQSYKSDPEKLRRILSLFGQAVARLPYPQDEWRQTLSLFFMMKLRRKSECFRRIGLLAALEMSRQKKIDDLFRERIDEVFR